MEALAIKRRGWRAPARRPGAGRSSALSPLIAFPAIWALGAGLEQIHLFSIQRPWSSVTWIVVVAVPLAFTAGALFGREGARRWSRRVVEGRAGPAATRRLRGLLVACVGIAYLELAHQMIADGAIPLLSGDIDAARFGQPGGPTILLVDLMTVATIAALCVPRTLLSREAWPEIAIAAVALLGFALQGGRELVVLPLAASFFARWLYWGRPRMRLLVVGALVLAAVVAGLFFYRSHQHTSGQFETELYHKVLPETPLPLKPLVPLDVGIATNFEALARVVDAFPAYYPYGHGAYDAVALHRFIPGTKQLSEVSQTLSPPFVVSTAAGPLWADGGMVVTVLGMAVIGLIVMLAYTWARRTGEFRHALAAGYLLYLMFFCVYTNLFTQELDWVLVTPLLLIVGAVAQDAYDPPGLVRMTRERFSSWRDPSAPPRSRRWLAVAAGMLIALVAVAIVVNVTRSKRKSPPPPMLEVKASFRLPRALRLDRSTVLSSNSDLLSDNEPLWALRRSGSGLGVQRIAPTQSGRVRISSFMIALRGVGRRATFDTTSWAGVPAVAAMIQKRARIRVEVLSLQTQRKLAAGAAPVPRAAPGTTRDLFVATWSGSRPDLFVIDRGLTSERVRVQIFSGESGFRTSIDDVRLPVRGLPPRHWSVALVTGNRPTPDLLLINRAAPSRRVEVQALAGESGFQTFLLRARTVLPADPGGGLRFTAGSYLGAPGLYVGNLHGDPHTVRFLSLLPPPPLLAATPHSMPELSRAL